VNKDNILMIFLTQSFLFLKLMIFKTVKCRINFVDSLKRMISTPLHERRSRST